MLVQLSVDTVGFALQGIGFAAFDNENQATVALNALQASHNPAPYQSVITLGLLRCLIAPFDPCANAGPTAPHPHPSIAESVLALRLPADRCARMQGFKITGKSLMRISYGKK